jgi:hypothetical protein
LSLRREAHLKRESLVDSRRNTPMVDFSVERHTLATEEITQVVHQSSTTTTQVPTARAHLVRARAQIMRRFKELACPI